MKMKQSELFKIILLFALTTYPIGGFCQQIPTINLVMKDGLSSNYVTDITQDKYGFTWFATRYGLNRFDGDKFTVYLKKPNQELLNSNDINKIATDTINNKIWIANRWMGVNVFDCATQQFSSFLHDKNCPETLISNEIKDILVTSNGNVWIATNKGLDLYDSGNSQFIHYNTSTVPNFPSNDIMTLSEGSNGDLYIGHTHNGFTIFSPENKTLKNFMPSPQNKNSLPGNTVYSIFVDTNSKIWIATNRGLSLFDPFREIFRNFKDINGMHHTMQGVVNCVYKTSDGQIWVGTISDLCYFDSKDTDLILSGKKNINHMFIQDIYWGISNPTVYSIFEDSFKNVWIGSNGGGASFISSTSSFFHSWKINKIPGVINGLNDKEVLTICVADNGDIWMGTDGGGINVNKDGKNYRFYSHDTGEITSNAYYSSLKDSNGDLWFGDVEIDIFLSKENRFIHYTPLRNNSVIRCLFEDNQRNIWIGNSIGLEIYNLTTKKKELLNKENSQLLTNEIRAISQDKNGNIWIGTLNKGITIYNSKHKTMKHINEHTIFEECAINQIFRDSKNRIWVATTEGLVLFPNEQLDTYQVFNTLNGLACNLVCSIEEDSENNIWLSTHSGISCFLDSEKRFLNYDHKNGTLFGTYMNNSVGKTQDGAIYFGSINGVCYFYPNDRPSNIILPPVIFTEFKVYGRNPRKDAIDISIPMADGKVTLNYNQNIFNITFNVMNKSLQGRVEYAYKLEGLEKNWINIGEENQVAFRNIPHRNYKLHIKARYKNQEWQNNYSTLIININPPFWLSWWAKFIYVAVIATIALSTIKSYKKRLQLRSSLSLEKEKIQKQQELNEERLRFYTNITHELKTPLTLILGPLEDLQCDSRIQEEHMKKISLIHKSTIRLLNLVTQILEFRKTETQNKKLCVMKENIAEKIQEIGFKYKELNRNADITFDIITDTDKTQIYFDQEVISMIVDNLLSNAFKYTYKGNITLTLRSITANDIEYIEIEIADTGIGIPKEDISRIFERYYQTNLRKNIPGFGIGLALVKNLVDLHEGIILVHSEPNVGSSFRIRLIANNSYPNAIHINTNLRESIDEEKLNKPIVLVVEDEGDIRDYIAEALMSSYDVLVAENGEQGCQTAFTSIPDVIISDIMMPIKDGIELCKEIKNNIATSHIPVILLTAKDTLQDKTEGYDAGADSYVTKPFSASLLKSRVANLLEGRRKIASLISSSTHLKQSIIKESLNKIDNEFIEKITKIIEENLMDEKIDVPTIAQELSMSYSSLYRKVKALTGMSTGEFIRKLRLRKAEQLLLSGKYNISEIAHQVGLNSVSYFRECFKEEYGMSPSEYIKQLK